jgi:hypothetical protein
MSASIDSVRGVLFFLRRPRRILAALAGFLGAVLYVWYAAVRAVPNVKARKAALRRERAITWRSWKA